MNKLVWKLLRQHISIGQLTGFFLANIFGMLIVLLSVQFYKDVLPVFTQGDSFMKKDYIIATKKISTLGSITGQSNTFSKDEIKELEAQKPEDPSRDNVLSQIRSVYDVLLDPAAESSTKGNFIRTIVDQIVFDKEAEMVYFDIII